MKTICELFNPFLFLTNRKKYQLLRIRLFMGTVCLGLKSFWARVGLGLGTSCLGFELFWVRVVLRGNELSWVARVVLGTVYLGYYELSTIRSLSARLRSNINQSASCASNMIRSISGANNVGCNAYSQRSTGPLSDLRYISSDEGMAAGSGTSLTVNAYFYFVFVLFENNCEMLTA